MGKRMETTIVLHSASLGLNKRARPLLTWNSDSYVDERLRRHELGSD